MASTSPYNDAPREKLEGEEVIEAGCTPGWVELTRTASGVYIVSMLADQNPENRWVTGMNSAMMRAWEAVRAAHARRLAQNVLDHGAVQAERRCRMEESVTFCIDS